MPGFGAMITIRQGVESTREVRAKMPFPDAPREIYQINPIEEVICQLRYPAILNVDVRVPADFQERIRSTFPFYSQRQPQGHFAAVPSDMGLPPELAAYLTKEMPLGGGRVVHEFVSEDRKWRLEVTRDALTLVCRSYDRWERFRERLEVALRAFHDIYSPVFYTRIGLRYQDVIRRSVLGLGQTGWAELLQPWIVGALDSPASEGDIEAMRTTILMKLSDDRGRLQVNHGLGVDDATKEQCYVIDADFFGDKRMEHNHATEYLNFLNSQSRLFFRWCIKEKLRQAMQPQPIGPA
jgi:uncharacterized protein (TIGR04255 family)